MPGDKSVVGDLINFRGLVYAPVNEDGVVFLFGRVVDDLHMYVEEVKPGFPDCIARRYTGKGWERVRIEFEYLSSNFLAHKHDPNGCDIVVCWEHDWKKCPIEVIELRQEIGSMESSPIQRPSTSAASGPQGEAALNDLFTNRRIPPQIQEWYHRIEEALREWNEQIWANIGTRYIGIYSPEKSFASLQLKPNSVRIEYFSRGEPLPGTKVSHKELSPRWAVFSVKKSDQVEGAIEILKEAHSRLKLAMKAGEPTSAFSGGTGTVSAVDSDESLEHEAEGDE